MYASNIMMLCISDASKGQAGMISNELIDKFAEDPFQVVIPA
jgi:hypothetical protein